MQNQSRFLNPLPILKKPPIKPRILCIVSQPPNLAVLPLEEVRVELPLIKPDVRVSLTLHQAIDYDKLTPTQQAKYDAGFFGSIELKPIGIYHYYYCRWTEPGTKIRRSNFLHKDWDEAIKALYLLLHPVELDDTV